MSRELKPTESTAIQKWTVADMELMAANVAKSGFFGMTAAQVFALMLVCDAEGVHPGRAVFRYHVIQGRPAMRADAMLADFMRVGGSVEWLTESDDREKCEAVFTHPKTAPKGKIIRFTMEDAKIAGLLDKVNKDGSPNMWHKYAPNMMRARVVSIATRMLAPGIVAGLYTPEEIGDMVPEASGTEMIARVVETKEHHAVNHDNQTGFGSGAYAPPDQVEVYQKWIENTCVDINTKWLEHIVDKHTGEIQGKCPAELIGVWQLSGHLLKFAKMRNWVDVPEEIRAGQRDKFAAVAFDRHREEMEEEAFNYLRQLWKRTSKTHKRLNQDQNHTMVDAETSGSEGGIA
jgi:hypothetical protein